MQPKTLKVIDQVIARRDGRKQVADAFGAAGSRLIILVDHAGPTLAESVRTRSQICTLKFGSPMTTLLAVVADISIVVPVFNEAENIVPLAREVATAMSRE